MKLSTFVATAAVIAGSFLIPAPAEARNGWMYVGRQDGESLYVKFLGKSGNIAMTEDKNSGDSYTTFWDYNCSTWYKKMRGSATGWTPIYPRSSADVIAKMVCR